jgi:hypothetical protein
VTWPELASEHVGSYLFSSLGGVKFYSLPAILIFMEVD